MLHQARTITFYTLLEALRNRLMWLIAIAGIAISGFLQSSRITDSNEIRFLEERLNALETKEKPQ